MDNQLTKIEGIFSAYEFSGDTYNKVLHMEAAMLRANRNLAKALAMLEMLADAVEDHLSDGHHTGPRSEELRVALNMVREI